MNRVGGAEIRGFLSSRAGEGNPHIRIEVSLHECVDGSMLLEMCDTTGQRHSPLGVVTIDRAQIIGKSRAKFRPATAADRELNEAAAGYLRSLLDFQRDPQTGLLQPKLEPDQTVIVDRAGARQVKALDAGSGDVDRIEKHALTVREARCTCPVREMFIPGFVHRCGIDG